MRTEDKITGPKLESSWLAFIPWMQAKFINNFFSIRKNTKQFSFDKRVWGNNINKKRGQSQPKRWPSQAEAAAKQGRWLGVLSVPVPQLTCASDRAHLCQWPCSLATPCYSQMDHRTEGMDIVTGGWRKDPPKIISKHSEGMWWRIYIYLASWTKRRIPFPNDFGVISFSKQFKSPCGCRWRLPSGTQWWQKYQWLHSTSPESTGQRESVFPLAKAQSKGSVEGSP